MTRNEKFLKEFKDLDTFQMMYIVFDFAFSDKLDAEEDINYSKQYFTRYYGISHETFKKWIDIFCPKLSSTYKKKRIFNNDEAAYIFENLGSLPVEHESLLDRQEAMKTIYRGTNWKKSRRYYEFSLELLERFPHLDIKLNKLPPKMMFSILKDELEDFSLTQPNARDVVFEKRLATIYQITDKYRNMSNHDWEVRRRWFRRCMNKSDSEK